MPKIDVLATDGTKKSAAELPALFSVTPKKAVLHQAVVAYLANQRQSNAHTKTRGEVSGGGRKPWKQKGTGRARAGSSRSPIWVGGGITFGPRADANHTHRLPLKVKRLALSMALSAKAATNKIKVIEPISLPEAKTKHVAALISRCAPQAASVLIVTADVDQMLLRAGQNIADAAIIAVAHLNPLLVMQFDEILITTDALERLAGADKAAGPSTNKPNKEETAEKAETAEEK